jgi:protein-tyrosine-phosphatase
MDRANFDSLLRRCPEGLKDRVRMVLEPTSGRAVQDPYYGGEDGFERNAEVIMPALNAWLDQWF